MEKEEKEKEDSKEKDHGGIKPRGSQPMGKEAGKEKVNEAKGA